MKNEHETRRSFRRLLRPLADRPALAAGCAALFVGCYAASGFLPVSEAARTALLTLAFLGAWLAWDRSALGIASALAAGAAGWLVEHTLVGQGLFFHRETTLDGIALWLPALYFTAALSIGALARRLASGEEPGRPVGR